MTNLHLAHDRWVAEQPLYNTLLEDLKNLVQAELYAAGIAGQVTVRTKTMDRLLKKLVRKQKI